MTKVRFKTHREIALEQDALSAKMWLVSVGVNLRAAQENCDNQAVMNWLIAIDEDLSKALAHLDYNPSNWDNQYTYRD